MVKNEQLDAVSVCTWNCAHAKCTIAALNAGINVLCEKPMATSAAEAEEMKAAAEKNGKLLMIGFVRRYGNDCAILKDLIEDDRFGEIYYTKATYLRRNGNPGGWFADSSKSGGGPVIDLGVHVIDRARYLMGLPKPVSVYAVTYDYLKNRTNLKTNVGWRPEGSTKEDICDVEDLASAMIRFDNGLVLSVEASFSLNIKEPKGDIEIFGTKAGAKLSPEVEIFTDEQGYLVNVSFDKDTSLSFDGLFAGEINHFVDCVKNGTPCIAPAEDGVVLMKILDAIYESARTGHEVVIS